MCKLAEGSKLAMRVETPTVGGLLQQLRDECGGEVPRIPLSQILQFERPDKYIVSNTDYNDSFKVPVLTAGQTYILGYTKDEDGIYCASKDNPVILFDDFTTAFRWITFPFKVKSSATKLLRPSKNDVLFRYVFYAMKSIKYAPASHARQWIETYSQIEIPLPPISVQNRIVEILDTFTELEVELEARKKQYAYYRDKLLSFDGLANTPPHVKYFHLSEICHIRNGYTPSKDCPEFWENGDIPWFRMEDIRETGRILSDSIQHVTAQAIKGSLFPAGSILLATTATIGEHAMLTVDALANQRFSCLTVKATHRAAILDKYLFHYMFLVDEMCKTHLHKGNFAAVDMEWLKKLLIPIPAVPVQQRIVDTLDHFDTICSDLKIGLPAEIEARQRQYEHYRDLILSFDYVGPYTKEASQPASKKRANLSPDEIKILQYVFGCAMVSISDIADDIYRGAGITREEVSVDGTPCLRYGELYTTYGIQFFRCVSHTHANSGKWFSHGDVLFAITGESVEDIASSTAYLGEERALAGGDLVVLKHSQEPRFLSYVLSTTDARNQKSKGKIKSKVVHSSVPAIKDIQIPLPPIEKQKEVADILDILYHLCYDLEQGIPAEISLHQKRSEYYRDSIFMALSV